jgi:hypothetical protein
MQNKNTYAAWEKPTKNGGTYLSLKTPSGEWITLFRSKSDNPKAPQWYQAPPTKAEATTAAKEQGHTFPEPPLFDETADCPF